MLLASWPDEGSATTVGGALDWVNRPQSQVELSALRKCIERCTPSVNDSWQHAVAEPLDLAASLHPRGRPPIQETK